MKRHLSRAALAVNVLFGLIGCQSKPAQLPQAAPAIVPPPVAEVRPPQAAPADGSAGSAEALEQKAKNWAKDFGPKLDSLRTKKGEPSVADFFDPDELRIGQTSPARKAEPAPRVVAISTPTEVSTPSQPNGTASIGGPERAATPERVASAAANPGHTVADTIIDRPPPRGAAAALREAGPSAGDLDASMGRNMKEHPKDVWAHLDSQLLEFLKDRPAPRLDWMASLSPEDRELITALMDGLTNFRNGIRSDNNMLMSRKVRPLLDLADRLRAQADLFIPTLSLCTRVDGFGVYEPVEPPRFVAMREHAIIVYCEVQNFSSHLTDRRLWETRLSQEVVLYTETGLPVWKDKTDNIADLARNRRHDFFVIKKTKFPGNITIGRYLLKVTIVDQQASRVAEQTIPVQFVAQ